MGCFGKQISEGLGLFLTLRERERSEHHGITYRNVLEVVFVHVVTTKCTLGGRSGVQTQDQVRPRCGLRWTP